MITGEKMHLKKANVDVPDTRQYRELRAKNLLELVLPNPTISSYLPDKGAKEYRVDEPFIKGVIATLEPDYLRSITNSCHDTRVAKDDAEEKVRELTIDKALAEALFARPFKSSKCNLFICLILLLNRNIGPCDPLPHAETSSHDQSKKADQKVQGDQTHSVQAGQNQQPA